MHVDYINGKEDKMSLSVISKVPKCQNDTLECAVKILIILKHIAEEPCVKESDLAKMTGKSLSTVKRIMDVLQEKGHVRRVNGKRYGKYWWMYLSTCSNCMSRNKH